MASHTSNFYILITGCVEVQGIRGEMLADIRGTRINSAGVEGTPAEHPLQKVIGWPITCDYLFVDVWLFMI